MSTYCFDTNPPPGETLSSKKPDVHPGYPGDDLSDIAERSEVVPEPALADGIGRCPRHGTYYGKSCPLCGAKPKPKPPHGVNTGVPAVASGSGSFV